MKLLVFDPKKSGALIDVGNSWFLVLNHRGNWENETIGAFKADSGTLGMDVIDGDRKNYQLIGWTTIAGSFVEAFQLDYFFDGGIGYYTSGSGTLFAEIVRKDVTPGKIRWSVD